METYILGVVIALLHKIIDVILYIFAFNSTITNNYEKIGLFLDSSGGKYNAYNPPQLKSVIFTILYSLIISPLGSWITVFAFYIVLIYGKYKKFIAPANVIQFNKEMKKRKLSVDEINVLIKKYNIT